MHSATACGTALYTNLFKSADQLLLAQGQVPYWPNHTAGCSEEEEARVQAGLSRPWHQNDLRPWRNLFLSKHLEEDKDKIPLEMVSEFNLVV